jgi:NAD dependent epimerase/dehydratase family enzyme
VGVALAAIDDERWSGAVNATAPAPARNAELASALGRVLGRPALMPVPALALRLRYGQMASLITDGARVMPAKALVLGYRFRHPELEEALRAVLA